MNICVLTHTFPRNKKDVAAAFMKGFSDGLVQAGNKVIVVTPFDRAFRRSGDPFEIVTYKYIWPESLHLAGYSRAMEADVSLRKSSYFLVPFLVLFGTLALLRTIKKEKIDIINVHWILPNGLMAAIASKITNVPFVVTLPGTDAYLAYRYKLFGLVAKWIAQSSNGITSNSSWHLNRILKLGVKDKQTDVISYPTDVFAFKPAKTGYAELRKKIGLESQNLVVLAVGRLVYKKGFNYLIKAISELTQKYPHLRLVIGGEGDLRDEWEKLSVRLGVDDKVFFVGTIGRDEIVHFYNLADIMVAPSVVDRLGNVDGGPVVSFESMACGKPQVATSVLGVADIIENNVNGFVVPQKDSEALANALEKLIKSKRLREKMGEANRRLIKSELNTKSIGEKYTKFFKQIVSGGQ